MKSGINVGRMAHHCGSRQGLNLFEQENGNIDGFCFSCKTYEPDPLNGNTMEKAGIARTAKTKEEIENELNEIDTYPVAALPTRKISKATMEYFKCRVSLDQERQENVEMHFYPYKGLKGGRGYKVRLVEGKRIWSVGSMKDVFPFGWDQAIGSGSKKLYITEGEIDAMSLFGAIMQRQHGTQYANDMPAVISIPHGAAGADKDLAKIQGEIRKYFKEIILVFDMDDAGRKAVEETLKIFPDAKVANLPQKDVNECVLEGNIKALFNAVVFNAEKPKNTRLIDADDLFESAKEQAVFGLSWPWAKTTEQTRGIRFGETIYIGAGAKMG